LIKNRARKKLNKVPEDYLNNSPRRMYKFKTQEAWITGQRQEYCNQLIDTKIQLNLSLIKM